MPYVLHISSEKGKEQHRVLIFCFVILTLVYIFHDNKDNDLLHPLF